MPDSLDDDIAELLSWIERAKASISGDQAKVARPDLRGPLAPLSPLIQRTERRLATDPEPVATLERLAGACRELSQANESMKRARVRVEQTPAEPNQEEWDGDEAALVRILADVAAAEATVAARILASLLAKGHAWSSQVVAAVREAARCKLRRIDAIMRADPAGAHEWVAERKRLERTLRSGVAGSDQSRPRAGEHWWFDKLGDLVALHDLIQERGLETATPWFSGHHIQISRRARGRGSADADASVCASLVGLAERRTLFVAGSTHPGEDELLIEAFAEAKGDRAVTLVLVPRLPGARDAQGRSRAQAIQECAARSMSTSLLSGLERGTTVDVLVVDEVGLLRGIYGLAAGAFIGGSVLASVGHNYCESLMWGVPTWTGPNHGANTARWELASSWLSKGLVVVERERLHDVFSEWMRWLDSGHVAEDRAAIAAELRRFVAHVVEGAPPMLALVDDEAWRCVARLAPDAELEASACQHCDGTVSHCARFDVLERHRLVSGTALRWFAPNLARRALRRQTAD